MGFVGACGGTTLDEFEICTVDLELASPDGAPGDVVLATGGPQSEVRDTRIEVGGVTAEVVAVTRTDCDFCDKCKLEALCAPCGLCAGIDLEPSRRAECFGDPILGIAGACDACTESVSFVVPKLEPGPSAVFLVNNTGQSLAVPFEVVPRVGGTGETGGSGAGDSGGSNAR